MRLNLVSLRAQVRVSLVVLSIASLQPIKIAAQQPRAWVTQEGGQAIAAETSMVVQGFGLDSVATRVQILPRNVQVRSELSLRDGVPRALRTEVIQGSVRQTVQIAVGTDSLRVHFVNGTAVTTKAFGLSHDEGLLVFQNLVWSVLEPTLALYAQRLEATRQPIQVFVVDALSLQSWTVAKTAGGVTLTTPAGVQIECLFANGRLSRVLIPAQGLDASSRVTTTEVHPPY